VDTGSEELERRVSFGVADIQDYAPASKAALAKSGGRRGEMTIETLCEAAVTLSDNTAANLLLGVISPTMLTAWLGAHGDAVTRLDRIEPALNYVAHGDEHDTTAPAAMIGNLHRILFGDVLAPASRKRLMAWLLNCKTGETRLKAGLLPGWRIAQKTGTLGYHPELPTIRSGAYGDVGVLFPPRGDPILIAAYTSGSGRLQADVDAWFASIARRVSANVF
jgi:beta-lactamase class A